MTKQPGFTLLELLLYFGLIGMIIFVSVTTSLEFASFRDTGRSDQELIQNAMLVDAKLQSLLTGLPDSSITIPAPGASAPHLQISGSTPAITFDAQAQTIQLQRSSPDAVVPLTNSHVRITNFLVTRSTINGSPAVTITYDIANQTQPTQTFKTVYYPINQ